MKPARRIGWTLAGAIASAAAFAVVWPHARDAAAVLQAQDDPAQLSDLRVDSALRNNEAVIGQGVA